MRIFKLSILFTIITLISACSGKNTRQQEYEMRRDKEAAVLNVQLASGYIRRGSLEVAMEKLLKAIEFDDEYVPAYTTMAVLMNMLNQPDKAEEYYQDALDIDHRNPELRNNYGAFLCKNGKIDEALEQFNEAITNQFYETPEAAHANIGYCLMQVNNPDYSKVEYHLRLALKANQNITSALLAMGELGIKTRKYLMSRAYMQRYHSLVKPDAHSLWIQIQAEYALGDREHFLQLSRQLLKTFPKSREAGMVMRLSRR